MLGLVYAWKRWYDTVAWKLDLDLVSSKAGNYKVGRKMETHTRKLLKYTTFLVFARGERSECTQQQQTLTTDKSTRATNSELEPGNSGQFLVFCCVSLFGLVINSINNLIWEKSLFQCVLPAQSERRHSASLLLIELCGIGTAPQLEGQLIRFLIARLTAKQKG